MCASKVPVCARNVALYARYGVAAAGASGAACRGSQVHRVSTPRACYPTAGGVAGNTLPASVPRRSRTRYHVRRCAMVQNLPPSAYDSMRGACYVARQRPCKCGMAGLLRRRAARENNGGALRARLFFFFFFLMLSAHLMPPPTP